MRPSSGAGVALPVGGSSGPPSRARPTATTATAAATTTSSGNSERESFVRLPGHSHSVRGVSFSPKVIELFCSGGYDGCVNMYNARSCELLRSCNVTNDVARINCVRFLPNGAQIAAGSNSRKIHILDVETGNQTQCLEDRNGVYAEMNRAALACLPNRILSTSADGKSIVHFDLRSGCSVFHLDNLHDRPIRDIDILPDNWSKTLLDTAVPPVYITASEDGTSKIINGNGCEIGKINVGSPLYSVTHTPEDLNRDAFGYESCFSFGTIAGICIYSADLRYLPLRQQIPVLDRSPVWKLRYTSTGSNLYAGCDDGVVRRYHRSGEMHTFEENVYRHANDIEDMDISINDQYLVTASQDNTVGLKQIQKPSHGFAECGDLL